MLILKRILLTKTKTFGVLYDQANLYRLYSTLELPYRDNQRSISSIPAGLYRVSKYSSPAHGSCLWVHDVPNRNAILCHSGNTVHDTRGCILIGQGYTDDGINNSKLALRSLLQSLPFETELKIIEV